MAIERVKTGIPGLDKLISGGFVKGSTNMVTGGTGTGKTTFCCQFLLEGLENGEPCLYLTMEEDPSDIKEDMKAFGFDLEKYEKAKKLKLVYQNPFEVADVSATLMESIKEIRAKRVVIDPVSLMAMYIKDDAVVRKRLYQLTRLVKDAGVTTLISSETLEDSKTLSRDGVTEFVVDGVIVLHYTTMGAESSGDIEIRKMRRTKHAHGMRPFVIAGSGIKVR
jgi:KaiC/GvpD/RAD55 family RecA-like ATPase